MECHNFMQKNDCQIDYIIISIHLQILGVRSHFSPAVAAKTMKALLPLCPLLDQYKDISNYVSGNYSASTEDVDIQSAKVLLEHVINDTCDWVRIYFMHQYIQVHLSLQYSLKLLTRAWSVLMKTLSISTSSALNYNCITPVKRLEPFSGQTYTLAWMCPFMDSTVGLRASSPTEMRVLSRLFC